MNCKGLCEPFAYAFALPLIAAGWSSIARAKARNQYGSKRPTRTIRQKSVKPVTYVVALSTVVVLPEKPSKWTHVPQTVETSTTAIQMACQQLSELACSCPSKETIALLDRMTPRRIVVPTE